MAEQWTGKARISGPADIARILDEVNTAQRETTGTLARALQTGDQAELTPDASKLLPVIPELRDVLPWPGGLLRGATVAAVGSTSLILALLAGATQDGGYACVVNMPEFGALAAGVDYRIPLERLALVPDAGPDWPKIVAILLDGVAMVVVKPPEGVGQATMRALQARARERGSVLVPTTAWSGADLVIERTTSQWHGLGMGRGRLKRQEATFRVTGRGRAVRERSVTLLLPPSSITGEPNVVPDPPPVFLPEPQAERPERPTTRAPDLWADMEPNASPDLWGDLERAVPPIERKRRG